MDHPSWVLRSQVQSYASPREDHFRKTRGEINQNGREINPSPSSQKPHATSQYCQTVKELALLEEANKQKDSELTLWLPLGSVRLSVLETFSGLEDNSLHQFQARYKRELELLHRDERQKLAVELISFLTMAPRRLYCKGENFKPEWWPKEVSYRSPYDLEKKDCIVLLVALVRQIQRGSPYLVPPTAAPSSDNVTANKVCPTVARIFQIRSEELSESENEVAPLESEHGYPASPSTISPETVDGKRELVHTIGGHSLHHNIEPSMLGVEDQAGEFGVNSPVSPSPFKRPLCASNCYTFRRDGFITNDTFSNAMPLDTLDGPWVITHSLYPSSDTYPGILEHEDVYYTGDESFAFQSPGQMAMV